jgi:hypothetical protein
MGFWWHVWVTGDPTSSITCGCGDTAQGVWWMEWVPWALQHGHTPFLSQQLFSRSGGVSALANTSALLLSLVFAPLTMIAGPVASFNLANLLAPVTSGVALFLAAGRVTRLFPVRVIAGALYAFSPFMLRNTVIGHLQLTWAFYPPLVFLLVMKLISDPKARAVKVGVQLGILTILQFFIGMETIALTGMAGAVAALVALAMAPRRVLRLWQPLVRALTAAAAVAGLALAYPLWVFFYGPQHVEGPLVVGTGAPLGAIVNPGTGLHQSNAAEQAVGYLGAGGPTVAYLGVALLVFLALSVPVWRSRRLGVLLAVTALLLWLISIQVTELWNIVAGLPLLSSIVPGRLTMVIDMIVALLLACSIDGWWILVKENSARFAHSRAWRRLGAASLAGVAVGVIAPIALTYTLPLATTTPSVPPWFLSKAPEELPGATVLALPFSDGLYSDSMFWQAKARFSYSLIAGWEFVPGGDHVHQQQFSPIGGAFPVLKALSPLNPQAPPAFTQTAVGNLRRSMTEWLPLLVVVVRASPGSTAAAGYLSSAIGRPPTFSGGVWSWQLDALGPPPHISDSTFRHCLDQSKSADPMSMPRCVLRT